MAVVIEACPRCGADARVSVHEHMRRGIGRAWSRSVRCEACGLTQEADSGGALPDAYRAHVLAEEGAWELVVPGSDDRRKVASVARDAFDLGVQAAVRFARVVPGVVLSGTPVEVAWFGYLLAQQGVVSLTRPISDR